MEKNEELVKIDNVYRCINRHNYNKFKEIINNEK